MGSPQKLMGTIVGGLAKENALQEACGHISTKKEKQEGAVGGVEGSPYIQLRVALVLIWHSEFFLNIVSPFPLNSLIFIPFRASYTLISWHGLCPIWSNLYAFILRAAP